MRDVGERGRDGSWGRARGAVGGRGGLLFSASVLLLSHNPYPFPGLTLSHVTPQLLALSVQAHVHVFLPAAATSNSIPMRASL